MTQNTNQKETKAELTVEYEAAGQKVKLTPTIVQNYIVGSEAKITLQEFKFFTELCQARKLNPFLKEAYLIKYSEKQPAQLVVSKDVILKRAVLHPQYDGKESGIIVKDEDGAIIERPGCFYDYKTETLIGGWCRVYRKDWTHPEYMSVSLSEVAQKKSDGNLNSNWMTKAATMVEKVAKVRALREAFVEEFAGMYIEDEIQQDLPTDIPIQKYEEDPFDAKENVIDVEVAPKEESVDLSAL